MGFLTKIWESIFNTHEYDTPVHTMRPIHEWPTLSTFDTRPTMRPTSRPPLGAHWTSKPPDIKIEPPSNAVAARESGLAFSLEKVLWVFLSGFGVMVLIAIFMKLGGPIRRVRGQLSNGRPAQNDMIIATPRPDDGNLDMASLLRSRDDLPPPYSERERSSEQLDEEPPPRYSACFVSFTNPTDAEPQLHIRRQNDLNENGLKVNSVPMNNSESVAPGIKTQNAKPSSEVGMRTELVFDNGRIVERLK